VAGATHRVQLEPAYVLHYRAYRDTSRILELFTRDHGRITLFARGVRGAKRAASSLTSILQPFHRVLISYSSRGEAGQLTHAEFDGAFRELPPGRALSGFYLNELLLRLFERHDGHPEVFDLYDRILTQLKTESSDEAALLRVFEKRLLEFLGYGLSLDREATTGAPVLAEAKYRYVPERGLVTAEGVAEREMTFSGESLLALHAEDLKDVERKADARRLLKAVLDEYLSGRGLRSREVLRDLRAMNARKT
jgi:DNA repair protein RecO (recombination protein O)